jgi:TPR repeat protein
MTPRARLGCLLSLLLGALACRKPAPEAPGGASSAGHVTQTPEQLGQRCDRGDAAACNDLGLLHFQGIRVPLDRARAMELYQRACQGKDAMGCLNLGIIYQQAQGVPADLPRAMELYQRACDGGEMPGCHNLGFMYYTGQGTAKDEARGTEYYRKACKGGLTESCEVLTRLGVAHFTRPPVSVPR